MRVLITGVCGFVGSTLARAWLERRCQAHADRLDNLIRPGSESNRQALRRLGVSVVHGDLRMTSDFESLPPVDWVIDAAANPSVLAGIDGLTSSRQLVEHNLLGTVNMLEYCRRHRAGFILLSTSRVYSIHRLSQVPVEAADGAYRPTDDQAVPGVSARGVAESFSTDPPLSLYGATKRASEQLALEYGGVFDFPVWVNRCGVLAGPRTVRPTRPGHFLLLDPQLGQTTPVGVHRIRRLGTSGPRLSASARPGAVAGSADGGGQRGTRLAWSTCRAVRPPPSRSGSAATGAQNDSGRTKYRRFRKSDRSTFRGSCWIASPLSQNWGWSPSTPREAIFEEIATHAEANPGLAGHDV